MKAHTSLLLLFSFAACDKPGGGMDFRHKKPEGGKPVATWSNDAITDTELKVRFAEMTPYARARYQTAEQRREYVDGVSRFELLAQEALKRGLANDPDVVETAKKVMVQRLLAQELDSKAFTVSEEKVRDYYEKHKSDFVKPAMTRLAHVFFKKENQAKAEATLAEALKLGPLDYAGFAKLARERSEEPRTQPIEGDLRFLSDEELAAQFGPELALAQRELTQVGMVLPRLVETAGGYHVLRLQGRQLPLDVKLDAAKTQIQLTLLNDAKQEHYRQFLETLKKQSNYKVDDAALAAFEVDVKAPSVAPTGPQPTFIPPPEPKKVDQ
ncbi:MAG: peptidyl-prolyl cis-trans isomerase [Archangiaceae bacterium]|nr:peptidyl-prolyl cis-trans isomerase [Archangiaceae bacterium]